MNRSGINRRTFLSYAAGGASGLVLGSLARMQAASARGDKRIPGANDRLGIGVIGCGGMANGHMRALLEMQKSDNIEIRAVCDVFAKRLDAAAALTGAKPYTDYRSLLDAPDIDYVLIASPEHWHHRMTLDALDSNHHVYVEKPMTHTIREGKEVLQKVDETGLKLQVGVQGMSDDSYVTAHRYIKEGFLGKVQMAQIDYSRNGNLWMADIDKDAVPGINLDWEAWLGPAPKVAWDPRRYFRWRRYWDYSGGIATDLFIHRLTRILKAVGLTDPAYVSASGGHYFFTGQDKAEIPDTFNIMIDYPEGPTVMLVSAQKNHSRIRHMIRGDKATLEFTPTGFTIIPQEIQEQGFAAQLDPNLPGLIHHQKTGAEDVSLHHRNLQDAIRNDAALACDARLGFYGMIACNMGVTSFRKRQYLRWDAEKMKAEKA